MLWLLGALALSGCPRNLEPPPPGGDPCGSLEDCNPGVDCGSLTLCLDGFCEAGQTLVRPCEDEGNPVRE